MDRISFQSEDLQLTVAGEAIPISARGRELRLHAPDARCLLRLVRQFINSKGLRELLVLVDRAGRDRGAVLSVFLGKRCIASCGAHRTPAAVSLFLGGVPAKRRS